MGGHRIKRRPGGVLLAGLAVLFMGGAVRSALAHDVTVYVESRHPTYPQYPASGSRVSMDGGAPHDTYDTYYTSCYTFTGVVPGPHTFTAHPASGEVGLTPSTTLYVDGDTSLTLYLTRVSFYVNDSDGSPVSGATVTVTPGPVSAVTDSGGAGVCPIWLPDGTGYTATATLGSVSRSGGFDLGTSGLSNATGELTVNSPGANDVTFDNLPSSAVPDISVPTFHNFGTVPICTTVSHTFTVANVGSATLYVTDIWVSGAGYTISSTSGLGSIAPGGSGTFTVDFHPTSGGTKPGTVTILSNDPDESTVYVTLTGAGAEPDISVVSSYDFGAVTVGTTVSHTFNVYNVGGLTLSVTSVSASGEGYSISSTSGLGSIAPGDYGTFTVDFHPTSAGAKLGTVSIQSNDPDEPTAQVSLVGNAISDGGEGGGGHRIVVSPY